MCAACTEVVGASDDASYTCSTAGDSRVSSCRSGFFKLPGGVSPADVCGECRPVDNAAPDASYTCSAANNSRVSACATGFWKNTSGMADACTRCTAVANAAPDASYTCSTAANSRVSACSDGFNAVAGGSTTLDVCSECDDQAGCATHGSVCSSADGHETEKECQTASPGYFVSGGIATQCTAIENALSVTCSALSNSRATCSPGFYS